MEILHMKSVLAASAVLALAGSSNGAFTLISLGVGPDEVVSASVGQIRFAEITVSSSYVSQWTGGQLMVTGVGGAAGWTNNRAAINNSSWFGIDPKGPDGLYAGGTNAATNRPLWSDVSANTAAAGFTANLRIGTPVLAGFGDGDNLINSIGGGIAGFAYAPQRLAGNVNGPAGNGCISNISAGTGNATLDTLERVFLGHFTLTETAATLKGNLLITLEGAGDPAGFNLNLDGTEANGVALWQVRSGNSVNVYLAEVPAPGALAALGLAGLAATRRRR